MRLPGAPFAKGALVSPTDGAFAARQAKHERRLLAARLTSGRSTLDGASLHLEALGRRAGRPLDCQWSSGDRVAHLDAPTTGPDGAVATSATDESERLPSCGSRGQAAASES